MEKGEGRRLQKTAVPLGLVEGFGAGGEAVGSALGDGRASGRGRLDLPSLYSGAEVARTRQSCLEAITSIQVTSTSGPQFNYSLEMIQKIPCRGLR